MKHFHSRLLYRRLLRLYPADFRRRFGREMEESFCWLLAGQSRLRGWRGWCGAWMEGLTDLVTRAAFEHSRRPTLPSMERKKRPMQTLVRDLKYAFRRIRRNPGFSAVAVFSLALGIGANSAIFTMVNQVLLTQAPFADPKDLVEIYPSQSGHVGLAAISYPELEDIRRGTSDVFSGIAAHVVVLAQENLPDGSRPLFAEAVNGNYFEVLGMPPAAGRSFLAEEDLTPNSHPVVMLGYKFWQTRYGGDPAAVGQTLRLGGRTYTIVGVAPPGVPGLIPGVHAALYAPMMMAPHLNAFPEMLTSRGSHGIFAKGRLREGVNRAQAQAALDGVAAQTHQDFPEYPDEWGLTAVPTLDVSIHPIFDRVLFPAAGVLLAVVAMVLLIACVNLASFLLARAADRRKEVAMRLALGAKRSGLIRQLLTETVLMSLIGGTLGVALAAWGLRFLSSIPLPLPVPLDLSLSPDLRVLLFTLATSFAAGVLFGVLPAWQSTNPDVYPTLRNESVIGGPPRRINPRNLLVVAQVAVSFLLLVSSGLFLRSLFAAQSADPGFGRQPTAITWIGLSPDAYDDDKARVFYRRLLEETSALPGVEAVGMVDNLALGGTSFNSIAINVDGIAPPPGQQGHEVDRVTVDPGYFSAAGVPILTGRNFGVEDRQPDSSRVAIVSQALAQKFFPDRDAVGQMIRLDTGDDSEPSCRVVGVARDTNVRTIGESPLPYIYFPFSQRTELSMQVLARASNGNPDALNSRIVDAVRSLDRDAMVIETKSMEEHLAFMLFPFRVGGTLLGVFGGLALLLASIGLYGVVSYSVASRRKEMGIRMSLGAKASEVTTRVIRSGMGLVAVGVGIGLALSLLAAPLLSSLLFGVEPLDWPSFLGVALTLLLVSAAATLGPALRASRVDPVRALRYE